MERDLAPARADVPDRNVIRIPPPVDLRELLLALKDVMRRAELSGHHTVARQALSVRQRMSEVLAALGDGEFHDFVSLFRVEEGRLGVVVTFLSILELAKEQLLDIVQNEPLAPIYVRTLAAVASDA
jgi:segregation and condensation protein A